MSEPHFLKRVRAWWIIAPALILVAGAGALAAWYGYGRFTELSQKVAELDGRLAEIDGRFASTTSSLESDISHAKTTLSASLEAQGEHVASVTAEVGSIKKLQALDPQLLAKYSKVYFLNENYMPARLVEIPSEYRYSDDQEMQIIPEVLPRLSDLIDAAKEDSVTLYVKSAYRSFDEQKVIKSQYTVVYGAGTANTFSADQGYSEHQLGTTVDLITTGLEGRLTQDFDMTEAYAWLADNAYRYGFILSYPKVNGYYIYEPWHWRYVGVKLATYLHKNDKYFYDLDQRTIDSYLISVFD